MKGPSQLFSLSHGIVDLMTTSLLLGQSFHQKSNDTGKKLNEIPTTSVKILLKKFVNYLNSRY